MAETAFLRATGQHPTPFATGIADLTSGRPARLLDVVEGRSGTVLADWLADRDDQSDERLTVARGFAGTWPRSLRACARGKPARITQQG